MKRLLLLGLLSVLLAAALSPTPGTGSSPAEPPAVSVLFSPKGGCQEAIIREINGAGSFVHVQAYSFTSAPIAKALLDAQKRGVKVEVVIDQSRITEQYSEATFFANQSVPVFADGRHAIAHNKVMIIDARVVITGSYNFTKAAEESNAENLLLIRIPEIIAEYERNYQEHRNHSVKYEVATKTGQESSAQPTESSGEPAVSRPAAEEVKPRQDSPADDPIVYVTRTGSKYHRDGCRYLSKSRIPMKLSEAKVRYSPCSVCNPPQ